jgi:hypothetical protein
MKKRLRKREMEKKKERERERDVKHLQIQHSYQKIESIKNVSSLPKDIIHNRHPPPP